MDLKGKSIEELMVLVRKANDEDRFEDAHAITDLIKNKINVQKNIADMESEISKTMKPKKKKKEDDEDEENEDEEKSKKCNTKSIPDSIYSISSQVTNPATFVTQVKNPGRFVTKEEIDKYEVKQNNEEDVNTYIPTRYQTGYLQNKDYKIVDSTKDMSAAERKQYQELGMYFRDIDKTIFQATGSSEAYEITKPINKSHSIKSMLPVFEKMPNVDQGSLNYIRDTLDRYVENPRVVTDHKDFYNTQIATQGGLLPSKQQIIFAEKFFYSSIFPSLVNVIPTLNNEVTYVSFASSPVMSAIDEGGTPSITMGEIESVTIKSRVTYQAQSIMSDEYIKKDTIGAYNFIVQSCTAAIARQIGLLIEGNTGAGDQIQGLNSNLGNFNITSLSAGGRMQAKPSSGLKRVINAGSTSAISLDKIKELINTTVDYDYNIEGEFCLIMNPDTWQYLSTQKGTTGYYIMGANDYAVHGGLRGAIASQVPYSYAENEVLPFGPVQVAAKTINTRYVPLIFGVPVMLDKTMPSIAAGSVPVLVGNFKKAYTLGISAGMAVRPLLVTNSVGNNLQTNSNFLTGIQAYMQAGGKVVNTQAYCGLLMAV
jgi:hypothetical protein